ncbi:MAG TPA: helix-turn-helix domain-containing protein [Terriglobia bacterium]|nr:helix-turn-helix domain-containing protein [Terriglobia bacterium]
MPKLDAAKIIKKVRTRLGVSQEGLSRRLNATKGAVQHWERGRNHPDLARLMALRQVCPPGAERNQLDALVKETQGRIAMPAGDVYPSTGGSSLLQKENGRLRSQITRLESTMQKKAEQLRILEDLVSELQRQNAELKGPKSGA